MSGRIMCMAPFMSSIDISAMIATPSLSEAECVLERATSRGIPIKTATKIHVSGALLKAIICISVFNRGTK
jgi:hypothetical protein